VNKSSKIVLYQITILGRWRLDAIRIFLMNDGVAANVASTIIATRNLDVVSIDTEFAD